MNFLSFSALTAHAHRLHRFLLPCFPPRSIALTTLGCFALLYSPTLLADITATLDRNQVEVGETVQLLLQHNGTTQHQPDLSPLKKEFDILGSSTGSSVQIINGTVSSHVDLRLTLAPKQEGTLTIPSLTWDNERSAELQLSVGPQGRNGNQNPSQAPATTPQPAPQTESGQPPHVFLQTSIDQPQPYVQAGVTLTVKLYTDLPLQQASLEPPKHPDLVILPIGKDQERNESHQNHRYRVIERHYLLFPQRSGTIQLEGLALNAQVPDRQRNDIFDQDGFGQLFGRSPLAGLFQTMRPIHLRSKPIAFNVRPRPSHVSGSLWLPAQQLILKEQWNPDTHTIHAGEPITRHLSLQATGLSAAQLPDLAKLMILPEGIKAYPDQIKQENKELTNPVNTLMGSREQDIALIANQAGRYTLPPIRLSWWDTVAHQSREAILPAFTITVKPSTVEATTPPTPSAPDNTEASGTKPSYSNTTPQTPNTTSTTFSTASSTQTLPWPWISAFLGLSWIATLAAWAWNHKQTKIRIAHLATNEHASSLHQHTAALSTKAAQQAFQLACKQNDPHATRRALLEWAQATWPTHPPCGLSALTHRLGNDSSINALLNTLDRACYAGEMHWNGQSLAERLTSLTSSSTTNTLKKTQHELAELYV